MRLHDAFADLAIGPFDERDRELVTAAALSTGRFELVVRENVARGRLDVTFARGDAHLVVPGALVDLALLAAGTPAAVSFPRAAAMLFDEASFAAIVDALIPHLQLLIRARTVPLQTTIRLD